MQVKRRLRKWEPSQKFLPQTNALFSLNFWISPLPQPPLLGHSFIHSHSPKPCTGQCVGPLARIWRPTPLPGIAPAWRRSASRDRPHSRNRWAHTADRPAKPGSTDRTRSCRKTSTTAKRRRGKLGEEGNEKCIKSTFLLLLRMRHFCGFGWFSGSFF